MPYFYGDLKTDELKTTTGLQLQGGTNNNYTLTLDTNPAIVSNYNLIFPANIGDVNQYLKINDINGNTANMDFADIETSTTLNNINIGNSTSNLETSSGNININDNSSNALLIFDTLNKNIIIPDNRKLYFGNNSLSSNIYGRNENIYFNTYNWGSFNVNSYGFYINAEYIWFSSDNRIDGNISLGKYGNTLSIKDDDYNVKFINEQNEKDTIFYSTINWNHVETMRFISSNNTIRFNSTLELVNEINSVKLKANPITTSTYTLTFPESLGTQDQVLGITNIYGNTAELGFIDGSGSLSNVYLSNIEPGNTSSNLTTTTGNIDIYSQQGSINLKSLSTININGNLNTSNTFSLEQEEVSIILPSTTVLDFSKRSDFIITVSGGDTLILASKNVNTVGQQGSIIITQTADTNSLNWKTSNGWYFPSAITPTLSSGTGIYDVFSYLVVASGGDGSKKILVMDATNFQAY